jgi:hypothetical protein
MSQTGQVLGILVNSDKYFEHVLKLAEAATASGKKVRVHVLDKGLGLFCAGQFAPLSRLAQITVCGDLAASASRAPLQLPDTVKIVSARRVADLMRGFDRTVVF